MEAHFHHKKKKKKKLIAKFYRTILTFFLRTAGYKHAIASYKVQIWEKKDWYVIRIASLYLTILTR